jgi:DNA-binding SARP family transcriptional activator
MPGWAAGGVMEFGLLGTFEVRTAGGLLTLGRPKHRALLALLLLHANRVIPRERLIDGLWGERPPGTAVKALQTYVSQLRQLLPPGMLVSRPPGYAIEVDPEAVDLLRFERLVADARGASPAQASSLLHEALALWRGPPLADFAEEPFARAEAGRLEDLRLAALEERIDADLALGRHAELVGELETLIAEHPHRERIRGQLMLALYRAGRQAEALEAYRDARAALDELGIEPGAALRQLERQILTQDATLESTRSRERVALPGALVPAPPFPFVGRAEELGLLRALLTQAVGGEGTLVLLGGEAGGGKTRLVRELAHEAAAHGVLVLYGASDATVTTPYQPLRDWLEFLLRTLDPAELEECLGERRAALSRLVPELGPGTGAELDRHALQSAACEVLRRVSRLRPLLLVADDAHWADAETLQLMRRLAQAAPEDPMLVLATYRDRGEPVRPAFADALAELSRLDGVARLSLRAFSEDEVRAFVETPELAAEIAALTGGNALLVCETCRDLGKSGALEGSRGPERIRDIVRQRLSRLSAPTVSAVELAAVSGRQCELRVLVDAAGLDGDALAAAVREAVGHGLLEELPEPAGACRFTHELVGRAVYDRVTGVDRAGLHLRVGEALERAHAHDPGQVLPELAHHFTLAAPVGGTERAVDYNLRAGHAAIATAAYDEAAQRISTSLELGVVDPRERVQTKIELAYLLGETGRVADSEALLAEALESATGPDERGVAAGALAARMGTRVFADPEADPAETEPVARRAIEALEGLDDESGVARARWLLAVSLLRQGDAAGASAELERALAHAEAADDAFAVRRVVTTLGGTLCEGPAPVGEAIADCERLLRSYETNLVLGAVITRCLSHLLAMAGAFDLAREHVERSSLVLDDLGLLTPSWVYRKVAAETKELLGDLAGAEHELIERWESLRVARGAPPDARAMHAACQLALLYCDQGRWDEAVERLSYGADVPDPGFFRPEAVLRLAARARLAAHRGDTEEALELGGRAVELVEKSDWLNFRARIRVAYAEVQRAAGATAAADESVADALQLYEAKGNVTAAALVRAASQA